jgi:hypothetical protein
MTNGPLPDYVRELTPVERLRYAVKFGSIVAGGFVALLIILSLANPTARWSVLSLLVLVCLGLPIFVMVTVGVFAQTTYQTVLLRRMGRQEANEDISDGKPTDI